MEYRNLFLYLTILKIMSNRKRGVGGGTISTFTYLWFGHEVSAKRFIY